MTDDSKVTISLTIDRTTRTALIIGFGILAVGLAVETLYKIYLALFA